MIFDTDILIDYLHGRASAATVLSDAADRRISLISYMEMLQGKSIARIKAFKNFLNEFTLEIIPLNESIGVRSALYMEQFAPSHGLMVPDALIAATAVEENESLCTGHFKHFRMIPHLAIIEYHCK